MLKVWTRISLRRRRAARGTRRRHGPKGQVRAPAPRERGRHGLLLHDAQEPGQDAAQARVRQARPRRPPPRALHGEEDALGEEAIMC